MESIQIVQGHTLKQLFEQNKNIKSIRAHKDSSEYILNSLEEIDDDKYYYIDEAWSYYIIIKEVSIAKRVSEIDTTYF